MRMSLENDPHAIPPMGASFRATHGRIASRWRILAHQQRYATSPQIGIADISTSQPPCSARGNDGCYWRYELIKN
jgi:hypothetical protein